MNSFGGISNEADDAVGGSGNCWAQDKSEHLSSGLQMDADVDTGEEENNNQASTTGEASRAGEQASPKCRCSVRLRALTRYSLGVSPNPCNRV